MAEEQSDAAELIAVSPQRRRAAASVPAIVADAGEQAVEQYQAFFSGLKASTSQAYELAARRFCRWAFKQNLSLAAIQPADADRFDRALRQELASSTASVYLTGVRALFRHLASTRVIAANPFEPRASQSIAAGFDLLALLAMLANMEQETRLAVFDNEAIALALLEQIRWPDGPHCPACAGREMEYAAADHAPQPHRCLGCGRHFTAVARTPFEASPLALRHWMRLIYQQVLAAERISDAQLAELMAVEPSALPSFRVHVQALLDREATPSGDQLPEALAAKDRELVNNAFARDIIRYAEMTSARDTLIKAREEGTDVPNLPDDMSLEAALAMLDARIAEADRWVFYLEDDCILRKLADAMPADGESDAQ